MARFFTALGFVALATFAYAQYTAWSLFDDVASAQSLRSSGGSARSYHK